MFSVRFLAEDIMRSSTDQVELRDKACFRFVGLPPEIRIQIYRLVLLRDYISIWDLCRFLLHPFNNSKESSADALHDVPLRL